MTKVRLLRAIKFEIPVMKQVPCQRCHGTRSSAANKYCVFCKGRKTISSKCGIAHETAPAGTIALVQSSQGVDRFRDGSFSNSTDQMLFLKLLDSGKLVRTRASNCIASD